MFSRPKYMIYVCQVQRPPEFPKQSCVREGVENIFPYLQQKIMNSEIKEQLSLIPTGCLGRCKFGPLMIIEPGSYMYVDLNREKIDKIFEEHLNNGNPVIEYLIPKEFWEEPK